MDEADLRPLAQSRGGGALRVGRLGADLEAVLLEHEPDSRPHRRVRGGDEHARRRPARTPRAPDGGVSPPIRSLPCRDMRVLIADDHPLILAGIKHALEEADGFEVVAEANTGAQVLPLVSQTNPDLCLLDMRMPEMDGLTCLDRIRKRHPDVKVVILSVSTDPDVIQDVLNRGASAYIVKSVNPIDVPSALRQALEGSVFNAIGLPETRVAEDAAKAAGLTERETSILKALARGLSNDAIGKELWVAEQTVKFHLTNIYRKLGVSNRTEATRYAYEHGLVESPGGRDNHDHH